VSARVRSFFQRIFPVRELPSLLPYHFDVLTPLIANP
jgi:hypothetical protein